MNDDDRRSLRRLALEMKARAGLLTDEERKEFRRTPILIGGEEPGTGVLVVYPAMTQEEWEAEYGGMRRPVENTAPAPAAEVIDAEPLPPLSQGPPAGDEVVL